MLFGAAILALAHYNYRSLRRSDSPERVKRIARIQAVFATVQPLLGIPLYLSYRIGFPIPLYDVVKVIHLIITLAIITQAASAATGFDMGEEKEFTAPSAPH